MTPIKHEVRRHVPALKRTKADEAEARDIITPLVARVK